MGANQTKIVILDGYVANPGDMSWDGIASQGSLTVYSRTSPDEILERCADADAVFVNKVVLTSEIISHLPKLKFIGELATGYNNIDINAARERGIVVCNVPSYSTESVVQNVFSLLLEITNRVGEYSALVKEGKWAECEDFSFTLGPIAELAGATLGIYGFGNIGSRVAAVAAAFGMKVISPTSRAADSLPPYVTKVSFDEFLAQSHIISLNAPLTRENRHIVNSETIAKMQPGVVVVNTARGALVDEAAMAAALYSGHVGAYGTDVLEEEPPRHGSPLIGAPNCFITPHIAWQSTTARKRLIEISAENLKAFLSGRPQNVVN